MSPFEFETPQSPVEETLHNQKKLFSNFTESDIQASHWNSEDEARQEIESDPLIEEYLRDYNVVRLRSARSTIEAESNQTLPETQRAELQRLQNLIITLIGRYTQEARITFNINLQMEQMMIDRDKGLARIDQHNHERSRYHEELNSALKEFNKLLRSLQSKGFVVNPELYIPATIRFESNHDVQRQTLGAWAITSDYYLRAEHLLQQIHNKNETAHS